VLDRQVRGECPDGTYLGCLQDMSLEGVELEQPGPPPLAPLPERIQHLFAEKDKRTRTLLRIEDRG
jgi:hypothetical protein